MKVRRGQVWYTELKDMGEKSSIQKGHRPVIVVSNDKNNQHSSVIQVISLTSSTTKATLPTHVRVKANNEWAKEDSLVLCEQIITIDKDELLTYEGDVDRYTMNKINRGMLIQLGIA
ncbi:type II toxin-antitoxin system PemK/MazF family toxin [uncultured Clostridium sp.]|uniref:type II toxin-antitoxin system PemK/MazF family toxin n=1 Tax=uncultured Clostridium sp. TaxID=59620 RepID=UPI0025EF893E|nr:type II toxin-antitoxin system PemK/MazF family toxin [uncultured Clostridium sp.]